MCFVLVKRRPISPAKRAMHIHPGRSVRGFEARDSQGCRSSQASVVVGQFFREIRGFRDDGVGQDHGRRFLIPDSLDSVVPAVQYDQVRP